MVEIAALGKPLDIRDKNEMGDFAPPVPTREIAMGDAKASDGSSAAPPPPSLRQPGEAVENVPGAGGKVQFPAAPIPAPPSSPDSQDTSDISNMPNSPGIPNSPGMPNSPNAPGHRGPSDDSNLGLRTTTLIRPVV